MKKLYKVIKEKKCCLDGIHLSTLAVGQEITLDEGFAELLGGKIVEEIKFERVKEEKKVRIRRSKEQMEADKKAAKEAKEATEDK